MIETIESLEKRVTALERKVQELTTNRWLWIVTVVLVSATLAIQVLLLL